MKSTIVGETKRCGRRDAAVSFSSDRRHSNSVVTLTQCSKELLNDAVSDTTDDDGTSERWLHNPQLYFKELTSNKTAALTSDILTLTSFLKELPNK